jgi:hypothetical protein
MHHTSAFTARERGFARRHAVRLLSASALAVGLF